MTCGKVLLAYACVRSSCFALLLSVSIFSLLRAAPPQRGPGWPHEQSDIAPSQRVTWGKLDNGVRYAVLPHPIPARFATLRLLVLAGSLHESEEEQGFAHFVEHMAFNGTRNFPPGELVKFFQRQGIAFGPHANAFTTYSHTLYKIDLPEVRPDSISTGLRVLRDYADGIEFHEAQVGRERGILLNENLARATENAVVERAALDFTHAGTLVPRRFPGGTDAAIKGATPAALRRFYDEWYRPERMVVIVAGTVDPAEAAAAIRGAFASLTSRGTARTEPELGLPRAEDDTVVMVQPQTSGGSSVTFSTVRRVASRDSNAQREKAVLLEAANWMIERRFARIVAAKKSLLSDGAARGSWTFEGLHAVHVVANGDTKTWKQVLATAEQELRRAFEHGFEPSELAAYQHSRAARFRSYAATVNATQTTTLAQWLGDDLVQQRVFTLHDERMTEALRQIEACTVEKCHQAFREAWTGPRRLFLRIATRSPPTVRDVQAELAKSTRVAVARSTAVQSSTFSYEDFGKPGQVARRDTLPDLDVSLLEFANGARLNVKRTTLQPGIVHVRLRLGAGILEEPESKPWLSNWFVEVGMGGLGRLDPEQLKTALESKSIGLRFSARDSCFEISGQTFSADLLLLLRVLAAFLSDPGFHPSGHTAALASLNTTAFPLLQIPEGVIGQKVDLFLAGGDRRLAAPELRKLQSYSARTVRSYFKPIVQSGRIELTIVGDVEVEQAVGQVGQTIGALPRRASNEPPVARTKLTLPAPPAAKTFDYTRDNGPTRLAFYWPIRDDLTFVDRRRLSLLAEILDDRLRVKMREEMGESYSFSARFIRRRDYARFAHLNCMVDVQPAKASAADATLRTLARELAASGITEEELKRAIAQRLASLRQNSQQNGYWVERLDDLQENPEQFEELFQREKGYVDATKLDLDQLAKRYLRENNLFAFTIVPKPPKK